MMLQQADFTERQLQILLEELRGRIMVLRDALEKVQPEVETSVLRGRLLELRRLESRLKGRDLRSIPDPANAGSTTWQA